MTEVLIARIFYRRFSQAIVKILLKTRVTPNNVTFASLVVGLIGSVFFLLGEWHFLIAGAVVWFFSHTLDCVDGDLARAKKMTSSAGAMYDAIGDNIKKASIISSLALGHFFLHSDPIVLMVGMAALINVYFIETFREYLKIASGTKDPVYSSQGIAIGLIDSLVTVVFFGALANQVFLLLVLLAVVPIAVWAKQILNALKLGKKLTAEGK